jgi:hypothetical protein
MLNEKQIMPIQRMGMLFAVSNSPVLTAKIDIVAATIPPPPTYKLQALKNNALLRKFTSF